MIILSSSSSTASSLPIGGCFRHQLLLPRPYLVLTKPLRLDIQCQRGASDVLVFANSHRAAAAAVIPMPVAA